MAIIKKILMRKLKNKAPNRAKFKKMVVIRRKNKHRKKLISTISSKIKMTIKRMMIMHKLLMRIMGMKRMMETKMMVKRT